MIELIELSEPKINLYGWVFTFEEMLGFEFGKSKTMYIDKPTTVFIDGAWDWEKYEYHIIYVGNNIFYINEGDKIREIVVRKNIDTVICEDKI